MCRCRSCCSSWFVVKMRAYSAKQKQGSTSKQQTAKNKHYPKIFSTSQKTTSVFLTCSQNNMIHTCGTAHILTNYIVYFQPLSRSMIERGTAQSNSFFQFSTFKFYKTKMARVSHSQHFKPPIAPLILVCSCTTVTKTIKE